MIHSIAANHAFSSLSVLELSLDPERLEEHVGTISRFSAVMQCAQPNLQHLTLHFMRNPSFPMNGVCCLSKLLSNLYENNYTADTEPLVFTKLQTFSILKLHTRHHFLARFLSAQPALQEVFFEQVYFPPLSDADEHAWFHVAKSLPPSCKSWSIDRIGTAP
jgi:hypothetical protein